MVVLPLLCRCGAVMVMQQRRRRRGAVPVVFHFPPFDRARCLLCCLLFSPPALLPRLCCSMGWSLSGPVTAAQSTAPARHARAARRAKGTKAAAEVGRSLDRGPAAAGGRHTHSTAQRHPTSFTLMSHEEQQLSGGESVSPHRSCTHSHRRHRRRFESSRIALLRLSEFSNAPRTRAKWTSDEATAEQHEQLAVPLSPLPPLACSFFSPFAFATTQRAEEWQSEICSSGWPHGTHAPAPSTATRHCDESNAERSRQTSRSFRAISFPRSLAHSLFICFVRVI